MTTKPQTLGKYVFKNCVRDRKRVFLHVYSLHAMLYPVIGNTSQVSMYLFFPCTVFKWYSVHQAVLLTIMISSVSELFLFQIHFALTDIHH